MAFQSGSDVKAKNQVLECGAELEVQQPNAHGWAESKGYRPMGWEKDPAGCVLCETEAVRHPGHPRVQGQAGDRHLGTKERL